MKNYRENPWLDPRIEIRPSPLHGKGMFAIGPIREGEVVAIWGGKYFVSKDKVEIAKQGGKKVQQIDDDVFEVFTREEADSDPTYFMNHSCNPNVWMQNEVTLIARRDIDTGEELTADYALWEAAENWVADWKCSCRSLLCRVVITGRDWKLPDLQGRYRGHFAPFVNRLIATSRR